jgi:primosomal protein N' (replication factor Y)
VEEELGASVEVLGPVEIEPDPRAESVEPEERALLRVRRTDGKALATALHAAQAARTARKATDVVRVRLDPAQIG